MEGTERSVDGTRMVNDTRRGLHYGRSSPAPHHFRSGNSKWKSIIILLSTLAPRPEGAAAVVMADRGDREARRVLTRRHHHHTATRHHHLLILRRTGLPSVGPEGMMMTVTSDLSLISWVTPVSPVVPLRITHESHEINEVGSMNGQ